MLFYKNPRDRRSRISSSAGCNLSNKLSKVILLMTSEKAIIFSKILKSHFHHWATPVSRKLSAGHRRFYTHVDCPEKVSHQRNCCSLRSHALWNTGHPLAGCVEEDQCAASVVRSFNRLDYWTGLKFSWLRTSHSAPPEHMWTCVVCMVPLRARVWTSVLSRRPLFSTRHVCELNLSSGEPRGNIWIWEERVQRSGSVRAASCWKKMSRRRGSWRWAWGDVWAANDVQKVWDCSPRGHVKMEKYTPNKIPVSVSNAHQDEKGFVENFMPCYAGENGN